MASRVVLWAVVSLVAVAAPAARADMGLPGVRTARPTHLITTADRLPGYVFLVHRPGFGTEAVEFGPGQPVTVPVHRDRIDRVQFVIVPRDAAAEFTTPAALAEAAGRVPGAVVRELPFKEAVPVWGADEITLRYRVELTPDGRPELVRTTKDQGYQCCVVACAAPVALVSAGLWLVRRSRRGGRGEPTDREASNGDNERAEPGAAPDTAR
ncbi:hypothetical protein R5W24_003614 [Gemmata sp. JC717]|uniref:hypothetical protein n=1 Tax=Gemmata algarum TaxID=2975278 RepID=UPI0021BAE62B|nr:hypothetical protein [Gemmata algarum]MDY3554490.1 hypothetical protein [Gemmata algarum]